MAEGELPDSRGLRPRYLIPTADTWHLAARPQPTSVLEPRTIAEALVQGHVSPPDTLSPGVIALRPGEVAHLADDGYGIEPASLPEPERGGLREALVDVVTELGEQPLGVLLSGGVDSAWLAALAAKRGPTMAFTTTFPVLQQVDFGADAAFQAGLEQQVVEGDGRLVWAWRDLIRETGLPQPDVGAAAVMLAVRAAVEGGYQTLLSGLGADEMAGGRPALVVPSAWSMRRLPKVPWRPEDARQAYGLVPARTVEWAAMMRLRADLLAPELLQREPYLAEVPPAPPVDPMTILQVAPSVGPWLFDLIGRLGARLLPTIAAIERLTGARIVLPYLDPRAVARGLAEPGPRKPAIRHGSKRELPDQIRARPKLPRRRPDAHWLLSEPLPDCVAGAFSARALASTGWFDPVTVHHWLQLVRARPDDKLNRLRSRMLLTAASIQMLAGES